MAVSGGGDACWAITTIVVIFDPHVKELTMDIQHEVPAAEVTRIVRRYGVWLMIIATCPYCATEHVHGGGLISEPLRFGGRLADCGRGQYVLVEQAGGKR